MPKKRRKPARKKRTREHIIADPSAHHGEGHILRCGFTAERVAHDYGVDVYMTTYTAHGEVENDVNNTIRYGDLWSLLRKLGFDCDARDEQNHRVCEFAPTDTRIVLHDYPAKEPVREEILVGVRLQLDNGGVLSRAEFDRWVVRRARAKTAAATNGSQRKRKSRKDHSPPR